TTFSSANLQTVWHFEGFDVAAGKTTAMVIPTLPMAATNESFFVGFGAALEGSFSRGPTAPDDVRLLSNLVDAQAATAAARQASYDAALRIENPDFHSPNTIDC